MITYKKLSRFILTRGLMLAALLLIGALVLTLRVGQGAEEAALLSQSAQSFYTAALVAFGCATCGSVLMEDTLRHLGAE